MPSKYTPVDNQIEKQRAKFCFECPLKKCVNCYVSANIPTRRRMFQRALSVGIEEDMARAMFRGGKDL